MVLSGSVDFLRPLRLTVVQERTHRPLQQISPLRLERGRQQQPQSTCTCNTQFRWRTLSKKKDIHNSSPTQLGESEGRRTFADRCVISPHIFITLEVRPVSCARMGPLLLSIALCLSAAVPQHVRGERKSDCLSISLSKRFTLSLRNSPAYPLGRFPFIR